MPPSQTDLDSTQAPARPIPHWIAKTGTPFDRSRRSALQPLPTPQQFMALAGFPIRSVHKDALCAEVHNRMQAGLTTVLLFANANFVMQCQALQTWCYSDAVLLVNDGVALDLAALCVHGRRYAENLNGTDFVPYLLQHLAPAQKVFLVGGKPGVAERAALAIERDTPHTVVGCLDGFSSSPRAHLFATINASQADIVLVALGNPLQEAWIHDNHPALQAKLFIGVGALLDFWSGGARRAPLWVQGLRCEWLYRLAQEPRRLLKRYTLDTARFFWTCVQRRSS